MLEKFAYLRLTTCTLVLLIVLGIALIGGIVLPASWGEENSPIEWTQVIILSFVCLTTIMARIYGIGTLVSRKLFLWSTPIWMTAIGRELSWGRVLYVDSTGHFIKLTNLWYGSYVHFFIACELIITILGLLNYGLITEIRNWIHHGTIPLLELLIAFSAGIVATMVEHYSFGIFGPNGELFEELAELVCYSGLLLLMIDLGFNKKIQPTLGENVSL
ncbi:hypothetical protein Ga0466249_000363 [Sporomusaceae bacterium BoRhaA]|uniref:hypothetical protein n=1 Tax=Pelorhabdus rhamnosifermentans TaxID=2772457 RepID=UPI001C064240|nr:hypothetical protein [Pelorhabdus rhamnosifermentans]MBU2699284.1 hypothetical protein [Pelorhabdus rhamnosifermentans]